MDLFLDSANVLEIRELCETGLISGVTTNPTLIAQSGGDMKKVLREICAMTDGPVSAEVIALDYKGMMQEAKELLKIATNIAVKVPLTVDGLKACHDGIALIKEIEEIYIRDADNITAILAASIRHPRHVIEAAKAGAMCATIPPKIFKQLYMHPLTEKGIESFMKDWSSTGQTIV